LHWDFSWTVCKSWKAKQEMIIDNKERIIKKSGRQDVYGSMEKKKGANERFLKVVNLDKKARERETYFGKSNLDRNGEND